MGRGEQNETGPGFAAVLGRGRGRGSQISPDALWRSEPSAKAVARAEKLLAGVQAGRITPALRALRADEGRRGPLAEMLVAAIAARVSADAKAEISSDLREVLSAALIDANDADNLVFDGHASLLHILADGDSFLHWRSDSKNFGNGEDLGLTLCGKFVFAHARWRRPQRGDWAQAPLESPDAESYETRRCQACSADSRAAAIGGDELSEPGHSARPVFDPEFEQEWAQQSEQATSERIWAELADPRIAADLESARVAARNCLRQRCFALAGERAAAAKRRVIERIFDPPERRRLGEEAGRPFAELVALLEAEDFAQALEAAWAAAGSFGRRNAYGDVLRNAALRRAAGNAGTLP